MRCSKTWLCASVNFVMRCSKTWLCAAVNLVMLSLTHAVQGKSAWGINALHQTYLAIGGRKYFWKLQNSKSACVPYNILIR